LGNPKRPCQNQYGVLAKENRTKPPARCWGKQLSRITKLESNPFLESRNRKKSRELYCRNSRRNCFAV